MQESGKRRLASIDCSSCPLCRSDGRKAFYLHIDSVYAVHPCVLFAWYLLGVHVEFPVIEVVYYARQKRRRKTVSRCIVPIAYPIHQHTYMHSVDAFRIRIRTLPGPSINCYVRVKLGENNKKKETSIGNLNSEQTRFSNRIIPFWRSLSRFCSPRPSRASEAVYTDRFPAMRYHCQ